MSSARIDRFNVVLDGTILPGFDLSVVRAQLGALIKRDVDLASRLLNGRSRTFKSGVDSALGEKYVAALLQIGVVAALQAQTFDIDPVLNFSSEPSSGRTQAQRIVGETPPDLYPAAIGPRNQQFYLEFFSRADGATKFLASWNWPAFFAGGIWCLYRKLYLWFFVFSGVATISSVLAKVGALWTSVAVALVSWLALATYGNSLYHRSVQKKIATAKMESPIPFRVMTSILRDGGVHGWVPWVFGSIAVIGIIAAIAFPAYYQDYN
ncbi:MAG: DUF2628 domain-containing protein [Betaproteobacteria bacterium]